jgi:hypothetical protein
MKKQLIVGLTMAMLVAQTSSANSLNNNDLERRVFEMANQLNRISEVNQNDLCAGDVKVAAAYIESTGYELKHDNHLSALTLLTYAQNELKEISNIRTYCAHIATEVKPYFAKVILMKSELENEPAPGADQTSD